MVKQETQETLTPLSTGLQTTGYALVVLGLLFFFLYPRFQPYVIKQAEQHLQKTLDQKNEAIALVIAEYAKHAQSLAAHQNTLRTFISSEQSDYKIFLNKKLNPHDYYDALLIDAAGTVTFAAQKTHFIEQNFLTGQYKDSPLGRCLQLANSTLDTQFSRFDNAFTKDTPSFFVVTPIMDESFIGFLVLEINPLKLLSLLDDHTSSGRTGEIILGQAYDDHTRFINKPRLNPSLQFQTSPPFDKQLYGATKGKQDTGVTIDYRKQLVVAAWDYVPTLDAGLIIKQDIKEVLLPFDIIVLLIFFIIIAAIFLFFYLAYKKHVTRAWFNAVTRSVTKTIKYYATHIWLHLLIGLTGFILCFCLHNYKIRVMKGNDDAQSDNKSNLRYVAQMINQTLHKLQHSAQLLAAAMSKDTLSPEELKERIGYELENNHYIYSIAVAYKPFSYDAQTELYAPHWIRKKRGIISHQIEDFYNYTLPESAGKIQTNWFLNAIHNEQRWYGPFDEKTSNKNVLVYSVPFFAPEDPKTIRGVVAITLRLKKLKLLIDYLGLHSGEKSVVIDQSGRFIFHPNKELVTHKRTVYDIIEGDTQRVPLSQLIDRHLLSLSPKPTWTYVEKIPLTHWLIASTFLQEHVQHKQQWLLNSKIETLISLIFFLLLLCYLLLPPYFKDKSLLLRISSFSYCFIMLSACLTLWWFIHHQKWVSTSRDFEVNNKVRLQKYLDRARQEALSKNLSTPIPLKTGIKIKLVDFPNPTTISLNTEMWQKYHDKDHASLAIPYIERPAVDPKIDALANLYLDFQPRLTISKKIKLSMSEYFRKKEKDTTLIGWKAYCEIKLDDSYHDYPFNKTHLVINLRHKDITKNIIPIPDFGEYQITPDNPHPWIDHAVSFQGYTLEDTFFSYREKSNAHSDIPEPSKLDLHVILKRNLLNPFYLYFMPFLVILFTIFSVLNADALSRVTAYTGLLFATILLNQSLRSALQISDIIYVEYLFFFTYITLLLLITQGIWARLSKNETLQKVIERSLMLLFWPFQLTLWFVTTLLVFYR